MLELRRIGAVVAAGIALVTAPVSHAAPFTSGSFAFTADTSASTDVTTATDFPLLGPTILPTTVFDDFAGAPLPALLGLPAGAVNFNLVGCCNWTDAQIGTFVGTIPPVQTQTTPHPNASATWDVEGQFTVGPNWDNAGAVLLANMTWTFTQAGSPTAPILVGGSFNAPRAPGPAIPEPATLALLGFGLAGLAAARRRKLN